MPLTSENLLEIRKAVADKVAAAGLVCFPTGIHFNDAADYWATLNPSKDTTDEIELSPVAAVWIEYLRFEDLSERAGAEASEDDSPITTRFYQLTVFRQSARIRVDETLNPDAFKKRLLKTEIEIEADINALCTEFRGIQVLPALPDAEFSVRETNSLIQESFIESEVECAFVKNIVGSQARLLCPVKIQSRSC